MKQVSPLSVIFLPILMPLETTTAQVDLLRVRVIPPSPSKRHLRRHHRGRHSKTKKVPIFSLENPEVTIRTLQGFSMEYTPEPTTPSGSNDAPPTQQPTRFVGKDTF